MKINDIISEGAKGSWPGKSSIKKIIPRDTVINDIKAGKSSPLINSIRAALQPGKSIWRGLQQFEFDGIGYIDPTNAELRQSANTSNYYTWWIDNFSKKWKDYPKRSRSFICSTDYDVASSFGHVYLMIPAKPTRIGVCPWSDFWLSFKKMTADGFNDLVERMLIKAMPGIQISNAAEFKSTITKYDKLLLTNPKVKDDFQNLVKAKIKNPKIPNLTALFDTYFDPESEKFSLVNYPANTLPHGREVWFSGPCYAVSEGVLDVVKKTYSKETKAKKIKTK